MKIVRPRFQRPNPVTLEYVADIAEEGLCMAATAVTALDNEAAKKHDIWGEENTGVIFNGKMLNLRAPISALQIVKLTTVFTILGLALTGLGFLVRLAHGG